METQSCILLAFDGSAHSMKALDEAIRLAKGLQAKLIVLHVYWEEAADVNTDLRRIALEEVDIDAQKIFREIGKVLDDSGVKYILKSERSTDIPNSIMENAEKENCEMIVIGNRGVGWVKGFLLGSVAETVASKSKNSVLIVK